MKGVKSFLCVSVCECVSLSQQTKVMERANQPPPHSFYIEY